MNAEEIPFVADYLAAAFVIDDATARAWIGSVADRPMDDVLTAARVLREEGGEASASALRLMAERLYAGSDQPHLDGLRVPTHREARLGRIAEMRAMLHDAAKHTPKRTELNEQPRKAERPPVCEADHHGWCAAQTMKRPIPRSERNTDGAQEHDKT